MKLLAHSQKDVWLIAVAILQTLNFAGLFFAFQNDSVIGTWILGALFVFLTCTNIQCVAHNFIHHPYFTSESLNRLFALWNTLLIGVPQTIYRYHHLNHHRFNNDLKTNGVTGDYSSIYRFSRENEIAESSLLYALLGPFRTDLGLLYKDGKERGQKDQILMETVLISGLLLTFAYLWPKFVFFCYLPVWYLGQAASYLENYFEHYGARPGNRKTDSVSCYSRFYNWIWFNNGYHQEHHYRPQIHWTKLNILTKELGTDRKIVEGAHCFNWPIFDDLNGKKSIRKAHDTGIIL